MHALRSTPGASVKMLPGAAWSQPATLPLFQNNVRCRAPPSMLADLVRAQGKATDPGGGGEEGRQGGRGGGTLAPSWLDESECA